MKKGFVLFLSCVWFLGKAQDIPVTLHRQPGLMQSDSIKKPKTTPYNSREKYNSFAVKGKLLPWFLGDMGGLNGLLGIEYGFCKRHSIGIDGYFYADENNVDNATTIPNNLPSAHYGGLNKTLFLNYRYYYNLFDARENAGLVFYSGALVNRGSASYSWTRGFSPDSLSDKNIHYSSLGLFSGMLLSRGKGQLGLDLNFGVLYTQKEISNVYYSPQIPYTVKLSTIDMRCGLNLYWWFNRKWH